MAHWHLVPSSCQAFSVRSVTFIAMKKQEFEIIQASPLKFFVVVMCGVGAILTIALLGSRMLPVHGKTLDSAWALFIITSGLFLLFRYGKKVIAVPTRITVTPESVSILNHKTGRETNIQLDQVAAYRPYLHNGNGELRLTLRDGRKETIRASNTLYGGQNLDGIIQAFEVEVAQQPPAVQTTAAVREPSFMEKPAATVLMLLLTAGLVWLTCAIIISDQPFKASALIAYSTYFTFAAQWYAARKRRQQRVS